MARGLHGFANAKTRMDTDFFLFVPREQFRSSSVGAKCV